MKYCTTKVIDSLQRKSDCKVDDKKKIVKILVPSSSKRKNDLGNGSWGKIDFLVSEGWGVSRVNSF